MFRVERTDDVTTVALTGELDVATAPALRQTMLQIAKDDRDRRVVVDLAGVSFIDVPTLGVLAATAARLRQSGGSLSLHAPTAFTRRVVLLAGLGELLEEEPPAPAG